MASSRLSDAIAGAVKALTPSGPDRHVGQCEFGDSAQYLMPAHFGGLPEGKKSVEYLAVTTMAVAFKTTAEAVVRFLPPPFETPSEPTVTVFYAMNREVEWLAGGSYNLLGVNVDVHFRGQVDQLDGSYCLALWENNPAPILLGRELLGIPKIFADIPDPKVLDGRWGVAASLQGRPLVEMNVHSLQPVPSDRLAEISRQSEEANWLGWRYVPNVGEPGALASHATLVPSSARPTAVWLGSGDVVWHEQTWELNPTQAHIVNNLKSLPVKEVLWASVSKGSTSLTSPGKRVRALY